MIGGDFDLVVIGGGIVGSAIAETSTARGLQVALIEIGPATLDKQQPASPNVTFRRRQHRGCLAARNHVLGGNGHYWGGGLMRPPSLLLRDCLGVNDDRVDGLDVDLTPHFAAVERRLGLPESPARAPARLFYGLGPVAQEAAIHVLPGRSRNVSAARLARLEASPHCTVFTQAKLLTLESESVGGVNRVRAAWVDHKGERKCVVGRRFVIAAGVVDSNLIAQRLAHDHIVKSGALEFGRCLHDHRSVPIARLHLDAGADLRNALAPRFRNGLIVGTHYELPAASGWGAKGFLHFTFPFDEVSPYRELKHLLLLRQQKAELPRMLTAALPLAAHLPALARLGVDRFCARRLFLPSKIWATATLDFESFPHPDNALYLSADQASLDWDVSAQDEASFMALLALCKNILTGVENRYGTPITPLFDWSNETAAREYFRRAATDAYHLGGGLPVGGREAPLDHELRLRGTANLHLVSSAAFARAGIVNPTMILLALADWFVTRVRREY